MPLPENYQPRKGDVVVLHARIEYVGNVLWSVRAVRPDDEWSERWHIYPDSIVGLARRWWEPGDRVRHIAPDGYVNGTPAMVGKVIATFEDHVWFRPDGSGHPVTARANDLEEAPEGEEADAPGRPPVQSTVPLESDAALRDRILTTVRAAEIAALRPTDRDERERIAAATGEALDAIGKQYGVERLEELPF